MEPLKDRQQQFLDIIAAHGELVAKVCYLYSGPGAPFEDLRQEVLANIWEGMDSFRGEARMSTWLYRTAINTCLTWHRRNSRHNGGRISLEELISEPVDNDSSATFAQELRLLHSMIARLEPLEKALITMWLDERPYEEIAEVTGLTRNNIAVKIHRIKDKLARMADA